MKKKELLVSMLALVVLAGCTGESADTSPAKPMDEQTRLKNIEGSDMTPEQKKAAADYVKQGTAQAERQKQAASASGAPGSK